MMYIILVVCDPYRLAAIAKVTAVSKSFSAASRTVRACALLTTIPMASSVVTFSSINGEEHEHPYLV